MSYPVVELQVVSDKTVTKEFVDNSTNTRRAYQSRTITGIVPSAGACCTVAVPERISPQVLAEVGSRASLACSRIEVVKGVWECVAAI